MINDERGRGGEKVLMTFPPHPHPIRKGHFPGLGRDPELDAVQQLRDELDGPHSSTWLSARSASPARCAAHSARPFSPRSAPTQFHGGVTGPSGKPLSSQMVSAAVRRTAGIAGCEAATRESPAAKPEKPDASPAPRRARAIEAGVEEVALHLQSGNGSERAARRCMHIRESERCRCFRFEGARKLRPVRQLEGTFVSRSVAGVRSDGYIGL